MNRCQLFSIWQMINNIITSLWPALNTDLSFFCLSLSLSAPRWLDCKFDPQSILWHARPEGPFSKRASRRHGIKFCSGVIDKLNGRHERNGRGRPVAGEIKTGLEPFFFFLLYWSLSFEVRFLCFCAILPPTEERCLSAAAFLNSYFHSLHVSNEVHWDSNLVTLVRGVSLRSSLAPPRRFNPHLRMTHTHTSNINIWFSDFVLIPNEANNLLLLTAFLSSWSVLTFLSLLQTPSSH